MIFIEVSEVLERLKAQSNPEAVEGMARFGINPNQTFGVKIPVLRKMAKAIGKNHVLAQELWKRDIREIRILASMVDEPEKVTPGQMDSWTESFDYWEICDQCCMNLFEKTTFAYKKAVEWSSDEREFVKRAGFVMMARLAVSDKKAGDKAFESFLPIIKEGAVDERNMVKKAVNWALRQIGKRNLRLNKLAIEAAEEIKILDFPSARWVASDAIRELTDEKIQMRLKRKG